MCFRLKILCVFVLRDTFFLFFECSLCCSFCIFISLTHLKMMAASGNGKIGARNAHTSTNSRMCAMWKYTEKWWRCVRPNKWGINREFIKFGLFLVSLQACARFTFLATLDSDFGSIIDIFFNRIIYSSPAHIPISTSTSDFFYPVKCCRMCNASHSASICERAGGRLGYVCVCVCETMFKLIKFVVIKLIETNLTIYSETCLE